MHDYFILLVDFKKQQLKTAKSIKLIAKNGFESRERRRRGRF